MADEQRPDPEPLGWSDLQRELRRQAPRYDAGTAWAALEQTLKHMSESGEHSDDVRPLPVRPAIPPGVSKPSPFTDSRWATKIAAVLVLGGGVAFAWRGMRPATETPAPAAVREVATGRGERATVRLADGTRVQLGPESRLRYAADAAGQTREVQFDGEGYFDVVHDERHPFIVRTTQAVIHDLGTSFNVRSYADVPEAEIVVADGVVSLTSAKGRTLGDSVLLRAGDLGRLEADGRLVMRRGVDIGAYRAWMDGRLAFTDTPLREALPRISRWYGVDIRLGDSTLAERRYTAWLKDETVPQLIGLMELSLELKAEHVGNTILLYRKSSARR